jgi:hypothetical protein
MKHLLTGTGRSPGSLHQLWPSHLVCLQAVACAVKLILIEDHSCGNSTGITPVSLLRRFLRQQDPSPNPEAKVGNNV